MHRRLFVTSFVVYVGYNTWQTIKRCHDWPFPPHFIMAALTLGLLDLLSGVQAMEDIAAYMAVGLTIASILVFTSDNICNHGCMGSPQPASYQVIQGSSQQQATLAAYQQASGQVQPEA